MNHLVSINACGNKVVSKKTALLMYIGYPARIPSIVLDSRMYIVALCRRSPME